MTNINHNLSVAEKRKRRVRAKLHGTAARPRLTVHKSNKYVYLQAINDDTGITVASANDVKVRKAVKKGDAVTKTAAAIKATELLLESLKKAKVTAVVFDRGQYKYHGRVRAVAQVLRDGGIEV
ncbi:MAG: 50S ribosomal protein L18 [Patescibacteria group bacterium]|nr:MAG: 50S ribosomal protein L18 [Patescibacteria group bacterium]